MSENDPFRDAIDAVMGKPATGGSASPFPLNNGNYQVVEDVPAPRIPGGMPITEFTPQFELLDMEKPAGQTRYKQILADCMNRHAILRYEERHWTKEGEYRIAICWSTYNPKKNDEDDAEK